ncbi:MAG: xanthine dehydrogenase family protein molybdopterin-binding subunit, partial [Desulfobacterales bacterium]
MAEEQKEMYYLKGLPVPETPLPDRDPGPWETTDVIGRPLPRVDGYERVSGAAVYPSDIVMADMLYGAILRCPHPHAEVKRLDSDTARRMPGVRAIISSTSPAAKVTWAYSDQHRLDLFPSRCRFEGETVAAVAADTPYQALEAARAIAVEYDVLPHVSDERKALEQGAPEVHPGGNRHKTQNYERGDVDNGFSEADVVLERRYRTACEIHTPLELHGCLAKWDGERLTVWESTQGVYAVQARVAEVLGLPLSKVRVIGHYLGGGFGSKLQPGKYTVIAALLARISGRPVKLFMTREDTYLDAGNRPPSHMTLKAGVKKEGTLTALDFTCLGTGGAYPSGGTSLVDWLVRDLYTCPNVHTACTDVFINAGLSRPFRAPGHPQGAWALEQMMDELAGAIGMDPVDIRLKNIPAVSQAREGRPSYTTTGLRRCIEEGARAFGWEKTHGSAGGTDQSHIRRGVGMAACLWVAGGGGPPSTVIIKMFSDGSINLNMGASDIGTGTKTIMAQVAAEELGVLPEFIQIENADTGTTQYATPSGGSKTVPTEAPAVRSAAIQVKRQLLEMAAKDLRADIADLRYLGMDILAQKTGEKLKITDISGLKKRGVIVGVGYRGPNPENKVVNPFAAQFCEVEVNLRTGEVKILRFLG